MKCPTCGLEIAESSPRLPLLSCPRCGRPLEQHPRRYQPRKAAGSPGLPHFTLPVHTVSGGQLSRPEDLSRSPARPGLLREPPYPDLGSPPSSRAPVIITMLSMMVLLALLLGAGLLLRSGLGTKAAKASAPENNKAHIPGTVTPASTITASPVGTAVYQSSLEGTAGGWVNDSHCSSQADGYHISGNYLCYAPVTQQGDVDVSVTVTQVSGPYSLLYGIVFRSSGKGNYYLFGVDGNGKWTFAKLTNNTSTYLIRPTANTAIKTKLNEPNTLEVKAIGLQFTFYVNGIEVGHSANTAYSTGLVGLTSERGVEVVYANIRIARP
jgi:hypothetical protein